MHTEITLQEFTSFAEKRFPGCQFRSRVNLVNNQAPDLLDCYHNGEIRMTFCPRDKYMDNHVVVFGPKKSWTLYCYSLKGLRSELKDISFDK